MSEFDAILANTKPVNPNAPKAVAQKATTDSVQQPPLGVTTTTRSVNPEPAEPVKKAEPSSFDNIMSNTTNRDNTEAGLLLANTREVVKNPAPPQGSNLKVKLNLSQLTGGKDLYDISKKELERILNIDNSVIPSTDEEKDAKDIEEADKKMAAGEYSSGFPHGVTKFLRGESVFTEWYSARELFDEEGNVREEFQDPHVFAAAVNGLGVSRNQKVQMVSQAYGSALGDDLGKDPALISAYLEMVALTRGGISANTESGVVEDTVSSVYNVVDNVAFNLFSYANGKINNKYSSEIYDRKGKNYLAPDSLDYETVRSAMGRARFKGDSMDVTLVDGTTITVNEDDDEASLNDKIHEAKIDRITSDVQNIADSGVGSLVGTVLSFKLPVAIANFALKASGSALTALNVSNKAGMALKAAASSTSARAVALKGIADAVMLGTVAGTAGGFEGQRTTGAIIGATLGGTISTGVSGFVNRSAIKRSAAQILSESLPKRWGITNSLKGTAMKNLGNHVQVATPYGELPKFLQNNVPEESYVKLLREQEEAKILDGIMEAKFGPEWNKGKNDPNALQHFTEVIAEDPVIQKQLDEFMLNTTGGQHTVISYTNKKALVEILVSHKGRTTSMNPNEILEDVARRTSKYEDVLDDTDALLERVKLDADDSQVYRLVHDVIKGHSNAQKYQVFARDLLSTPPATFLQNVGAAMHTVYGMDDGFTTHLKKIFNKGMNSEKLDSESANRVFQAMEENLTAWSKKTQGVQASIDALNQAGPPTPLLSNIHNEFSRLLNIAKNGGVPHPSEVDNVVVLAKKLRNELSAVRDSNFKAADNIVKGLEDMSDTANRQVNALRTFGRDMHAMNQLQDIEVGTNVSVSNTPKVYQKPEVDWHLNRYDSITNNKVSKERLVMEFDQLSGRSKALHSDLADELLSGAGEIDITKYKTASRSVKNLIKTHNTSVKALSRASEVVNNVAITPASKYATLMRIADNSPVPHVRRNIRKEAAGYVDVITHDISAMNIPTQDKVRILKAIQNNPISEIMKALNGQGSPEQLVDLLNYKQWYGDLLGMQDKLGGELVNRYSQLYKQRFGDDLNIAEFLANFVTTRSGYDLEKNMLKVLNTTNPKLAYAGIWGESIAGYKEKNLRYQKLTGAWSSMLGHDAFQSRFAAETGLSASEGLTAKNIAHRRAKTLTTEFISESLNSLRKFIPDIVSNIKVKELWKVLKGVSGFNQTFNTHVFSEAGELILTDTGAIVKNFTSDVKAYTKYTDLLENHDESARLFFKDWLNKNHPDFKDHEMFSNYFGNYFYSAGGAPYSADDWRNVFRALEWEAGIDARKLAIVNREIESGNKLYKDKGYQLENIQHRQFRVSNKKAASDSFLADVTKMDSVEARMFQRGKSSSDMAQQAKTELLSVHEVMDPIESILTDSRDLIRYGTTAHASRMLDDLGVLAGSFGHKSSQAWLSGEAGTALGMYQQSIYSRMKYNWQKKSSHFSAFLNLSDAIVNPFSSLASLRSIFYTTLQAGITSAGTTGVHKGNIAKSLYITAKRALWHPLKTYGRILNVVKYDIEGMNKTYKGLMNSPAANLTIEQVAQRNVEKIIMESGDAPILQNLQSMITASAGNRRIGKTENLSLDLIRASEEHISAPIFKALKERTERLVSRSTLDEGVKVYAQVKNLVNQGRLKEAEELITSMSPNLKKADAFALLRTVETHLKTNTEEVGMHRFLTNYHDAQVGRFGFHVSPSRIKKLAEFLPGMSQFYSSKMLAFTRLAQNVAHGATGIRGSGQNDTASMMYATIAMLGLSSMTTAIGKGTDLLGPEPKSRAGLLPGFERANPLPEVVTNMARYAMGDSQADVPSISLQEVLTSFLVAQPTTRFTSSSLLDLPTSAKLQIFTGLAEAASTLAAEGVSGGSAISAARNNLAFRSRFSSIFNAYESAVTEEEKMKAGEKLLKEYESYKDSSWTRVMDTVLNNTAIAGVFKGIVEDPATLIMVIQDIDDEDMMATTGSLTRDQTTDMYYEGTQVGKKGHIPVKGAMEQSLFGDMITDVYSSSWGRGFYDTALKPFFGTPDQDLFSRVDAIINRLAKMGVISDAEKQSYRNRYAEYCKDYESYDKERMDEIETMFNEEASMRE